MITNEAPVFYTLKRKESWRAHVSKTRNRQSWLGGGIERRGTPNIPPRGGGGGAEKVIRDISGKKDRELSMSKPVLFCLQNRKQE